MSKSLLKDAKAAIKNRDFATALKLSKAIVKEDRSNYMGLVFLGLSLQEEGPHEQAPKAFRKAIELDGLNPLAWQGLMQFYEKTNNNKELVVVYKQFLLLNHADKLVEVANKFVNLLDVPEREDVEFLKQFSNNDVLKLAAQVFERIPDSEKPLDLQESLISDLKASSSITESFYLSFIAALNRKGQFNRVLEHAKTMHAMFPDNLTPLRWICKIFIQFYIQHIQVEDLNEFIDKLLNCDANDSMGRCAKSVLLIKDRKFAESKQNLENVQPSIFYWILLTEIYIKLHVPTEAARALEEAKKLTSSFCDKRLQDLQVEILAISEEMEMWISGYDIVCQKEFDSFNCVGAAITLCCHLHEYSKAESLLQINKSLNYKLKILRLQNRLEEAKNLIKNNLENTNSEWWLEVGRFYVETHDFPCALDAFLKAAKNDPNNFECFQKLGEIYAQLQQFDKSRRCYEKAFKLNQYSSKIASELSKIYRKLHYFDANLALLQKLTGTVPTKDSLWAWLSLGLTYLDQGDAARAVDSLRTVIRLDSDNMRSWEALGDAYLAKGSFTASLKCYQKSESLYSTLQVANIKKLLGDFVAAQKDFEEILKTNPKYVPALKGLSETLFGLAVECFGTQRIGTARDYCQLAVNNITWAILQRSELVALWKLIADIVYLVAKLPEKYSFLTLDGVFFNTPDGVVKESNELQEVIIKFRKKAVSLDKTNSFLWHDLATAYIAIKDYEFALECALQATMVTPEVWQHWNLLGVVAILTDNYALAQHSFIKAVVADNSSAISWTNLGILYLILSDVKLANQSFGEAQRSDPNYVNCWIGQSLIAELIGHFDKIGLFRHCTALDQNQQGSLGYANAVCEMLLDRSVNQKIYEDNIVKLHAIPVAYDNIVWYTEKNPDNACAWNIQGILAERLNLLGSALKAFKMAFVMAEAPNKDLARINFGRLRYRIGDYNGAIDMFANVKQATFSSGAALALALFKNGQYEDSYEAYDEALESLTDKQSDQSDLLVALASMAYMFQGPEVAKSILIKSVELVEPSHWSLFACLSLALLHNDVKFKQLILRKLSQVKRTPDFVHHYTKLLYALYMISIPARAKAGLSKLIHEHPNHPTTWQMLAESLVHQSDASNQLLKAAVQCAKMALTLGQNSQIDIAKLQNLAASLMLRAGDSKMAQMYAQKAIFYRPNSKDSWNLLKQTNK